MTYQQYDYAPPAPARDPNNLDLPLYGASFGEAIKRFFRSYFRYRGRASQSEYWWPFLANAIVVVVSYVLMFLSFATASDPDNMGAVSTAIMIVSFTGFFFAVVVMGIGYIALSVRRLHDANASGWWYLLVVVGGLIPLLGVAGPIIVGVLSSSRAGCRFDRGAQAAPTDHVFP
ncbi:Inner membrane protein yhaI OS=Tsukamurella paurometabola (strain ATCC 8368 / DSM / CCUG 35730/ CIP 100753 / JCM 10117 / KCTC 9821 / NBRC 16120 / NCIMB 702349 / NCTC 13040) OX=521096 GN=Tpau_4184 PE=4 SV=1 [Tsukamurella paurometabola]|uniref:Inner membrane protein yhaI n=1 Tax=Tsukamurella paurometabola (strain ATCC 8368 / DSM 20162 / CCUG 35730 / CIP 100753 / JCM 10117 / KCTC 9821 / NBRC 16120 / NCIMB 702349 / NCTC 13040) TaxID=521096 RepID=D5UP44_TSUPD|nr:DUF805 domain-containing protein [Tsukamurella paurometabola]ADG80753.1 protein of unknown function DUF805 [Tsukamurella paurometabola DSM 20162]SUP40835.1 Inner membrane protein yhaH [Tsukamurella paurometabola]